MSAMPAKRKKVKKTSAPEVTITELLGEYIENETLQDFFGDLAASGVDPQQVARENPRGLQAFQNFTSKINRLDDEKRAELQGYLRRQTVQGRGERLGTYVIAGLASWLGREGDIRSNVMDLITQHGEELQRIAEVAAATKIQAAERGRQARKRVVKQKAEQENERALERSAEDRSPPSPAIPPAEPRERVAASRLSNNGSATAGRENVRGVFEGGMGGASQPPVARSISPQVTAYGGEELALPPEATINTTTTSTRRSRVMSDQPRRERNPEVVGLETKVEDLSRQLQEMSASQAKLMEALEAQRSLVDQLMEEREQQFTRRVSRGAKRAGTAVASGAAATGRAARQAAVATGEAAQYAARATSEAAKNGVEVLGTVVHNALEAVTEAGKAIAAGTREAAKSAQDVIVRTYNALQRDVERAMEWSRELPERAMEWARELPGKAREFSNRMSVGMVELGNNALTLVEGARDLVVNCAKGVWTGAKKAFSNLERKAQSVKQAYKILREFTLEELQKTLTGVNEMRQQAFAEEADRQVNLVHNPVHKAAATRIQAAARGHAARLAQQRRSGGRGLGG